MLASLILSKRQGMFFFMKRLAFVIAVFIAAMTPAQADFAAGFAAYSRGDYEAAVSEWLPLAEQGDIKAQVGLGFMHEKGLGVPQDFTKAVRWYRRAADQGDNIARYNLGVMYGNGTGVLQDYIEAHKLFSLAAAGGNEDAKNSLSYIEKLMTPSQLAQSKRNSLEAVNKPAAGAPQVAAAPQPDAKIAPQAESAQAPPEPPLIDPAKAAPSPPSPQIAAVKATTPQAKATPVATAPTIEVAARPAPSNVPAPAPAPARQSETAKPVVPESNAAVQVAARPPALPPSPVPATGPWSVHLVSIKNEGAVEGEWQRLRKLHPLTLDTMSLNVQAIDIPEKGRFYRVLAGAFDSKASAESACAAIEAEGQYCRPMRRE